MKDFVRRFDLSEAPLFRIGLQTLGHNRHMLLFDMHHLISDGVSISIMLKELADIYGGNQLPELRIQYKDYAVWQAERAKEGYKKERAHWKEVFSGELPVLQLLPDYPRPQVQSFEGDRVSAKLPKMLRERLRKLAEKNGATLYMCCYQLTIRCFLSIRDRKTSSWEHRQREEITPIPRGLSGCLSTRLRCEAP